MSEKYDQTQKNEVKLKRVYGFPSLVFFGLVFMGPSIILTIFGTEQITTNGHVTLAMAIAAAIAVVSCLSYAKMVEVFPSAGSSYTFTTKGVNPKLGFMAGWVMLVDYCVSPMFMFAVCGRYFSRMYPVFSWQVWVLIIAAIVLIMNVLGLKASKLFNLSAGILQLALALLLSVLGVVYLNTNGAPEPASTVIFDAGDFTAMGLFAGMAVAFMSYLGFDGITTLAEESTVSPKKMGHAIVLSVVLQGICLTGVGFICAMMMPRAADIANPDTVGVDLYNMVQSSTVFTNVCMTIKQVLVIMAAVNVTAAATRLMYAMGRQSCIRKAQQALPYAGTEYYHRCYSILYRRFVPRLGYSDRGCVLWRAVRIYLCKYCGYQLLLDPKKRQKTYMALSHFAGDCDSGGCIRNLLCFRSMQDSWG